jgi:hypothetical protein
MSSENHIEHWEIRTGRSVDTMTEDEALDLLWLKSPLYRRACALAGDPVDAMHVIIHGRRCRAGLMIFINRLEDELYVAKRDVKGGINDQTK